MFRVGIALLVCLVCCECMSPQALSELRAERQAKAKAELEAAKIPAVRLSETQIAKLKEMAPVDRIVWYGAGRQSDGKIFVCLVTHGENRFISGSHTQLFAGTFDDSEGSFHQTLAYLQSPYAVVRDCRSRGLDPPVRICQTQYFTTSCP